MFKNTLRRIILIAGSLLILVGVTLMCWMHMTENERNVIKVKIFDKSTETLSFENLSLVPGEECEYTVILKGDKSKKYDLHLEFAEIEEKTLKNYARVKIVGGEKTIYDGLLAEAFANKSIYLSVDFNKNENTELKVIYYLPMEIGNEAKNAGAVFELRITASNE